MYVFRLEVVLYVPDSQTQLCCILFATILNDELSISWLYDLISKTDSFKRVTLWKRIVPIISDDQIIQANKRF